MTEYSTAHESEVHLATCPLQFHSHGGSFSVRRLRRVESDDGGRVRSRPSKLRRGLPGLLQTEPAAHRLGSRRERVLDHFRVGVNVSATNKEDRNAAPVRLFATQADWT